MRGSALFKPLRTSKLVLAFLIASSCQRVGTERLEPQISFTISDTYLKRLPSAFSPLTLSEKKTEWGREYMIGLVFAEELDLYRAITSFKRAEILMSESNNPRKRELQYNTLLCYYLGKRYEEVIETFNASSLRYVDTHFSTYEDLLIILYDSYLQTGETLSADLILDHMKQHFPETAEKLALSGAFLEADFRELKTACDRPYVQELFNCYAPCAKSIGRAEFLNMVIPGAGYLYVGQKQSALTAFLLNGLFIGAATYFFLDGNIPAGLIVTSFEAGWYFGGIYGAGEAAKLYNERLYETCAYPIMRQHRLFPILSLRYGF